MQCTKTWDLSFFGHGRNGRHHIFGHFGVNPTGWFIGNKEVRHGLLACSVIFEHTVEVQSLDETQSFIVLTTSSTATESRLISPPLNVAPSLVLDAV